MLAEAVAVIVVVASVLTIGKRVKVTVKRATLRPYILSQVKILIGGEVLVKKKKKRSSIGRNSANIKLYGYYTFLKRVLARLLLKANFIYFLS